MSRGSLARLALLAVVWGSSFLWIKLALRGLSPVQITLVRLVLGTIVLIAIGRARGLRLPRGTRVWAHLTVAAFLANAAPYLLFAVGERTVSSGLAGMLNSTVPLWTLAVGLLTRHETRLSPVRAAGLALGFAGTLLILTPWQSGVAGSVWGALACLGAALGYGIGYVYMARHLTGRGIPAVSLSAAQLVAATGLLVAVTPIAGLQPVHLRADALIGVAILGVLGTGIAYALNYRLISDDGATAASTVTYLIPIVSVALGAAALGEPLSVHAVVGMAVVLAGLSLVQRTPRPRSVPAPSKADVPDPSRQEVIRPERQHC